VNASRAEPSPSVEPEPEPEPESESEPDWGRTPAHQRSGLALNAVAMIENTVILLLLAGTVLVILAQIVFRRFLDQPLSWSTEVATELLVYVAFVGFAIGIRDNVHVAMRAFEDRFPNTVQRGLRMVELLVMGAVVAAIGIGGGIYAYEQRDVTTPAGLPLWIAFAALPAGCALGCLHVLVELIAVGRGRVEPVQLPVGAAA
jgi:TRAP-type C4-dicarboxylate transport system permease small subunit